MNKSIYEALKFIEMNKIDFFVHVTFPYVKCDDLDFTHNGAFFLMGDFSKYHGYAKFSKQHPTEYDWGTAMGIKNTRKMSRKKHFNDPKAKNACTGESHLTFNMSSTIMCHVSCVLFSNEL